MADMHNAPMNRSPHILNAASNLLGICFLIITGLALTRNPAYTRSDTQASIRSPSAVAASAAFDPLQLGATWNGSGTNFAVASRVADAMTLCLFDEAGQETRIPLRDYDGASGIASCAE